MNAGRRRVVDLGADDVAGQQVGRALDPAERPAHGVGQRRRGGRLGQAGDALEEDVAAGQQADEQRLLQPALTHDLAAERLRQPLQRVSRPRHLVGAQDGSGGLFHRVIVNNVGMRRRRSAYRPAPPAIRYACTHGRRPAAAAPDRPRHDRCPRPGRVLPRAARTGIPSGPRTAPARRGRPGRAGVAGPAQPGREPARVPAGRGADALDLAGARHPAAAPPRPHGGDPGGAPAGARPGARARRAVLRDESQDEIEPIYVYADPAGHPFCIFVAPAPEAAT